MYEGVILYFDPVFRLSMSFVRQAGKPRTISGFQTYQAPARLATTERAKLATEEYTSFVSVLEWVRLAQKDPGWEKMES